VQIRADEKSCTRFLGDFAGNLAARCAFVTVKARRRRAGEELRRKERQERKGKRLSRFHFALFAAFAFFAPIFGG